jgi:hypothetical protein
VRVNHSWFAVDLPTNFIVTGGIMSNTTFTSFTEILTSLYNGNRGEAQQTAEVIKYDNTADLSEESQRHKQYRANYEALRLKKYFEDVTIH